MSGYDDDNAETIVSYQGNEPQFLAANQGFTTYLVNDLPDNTYNDLITPGNNDVGLFFTDRLTFDSASNSGLYNLEDMSPSTDMAFIIGPQCGSDYMQGLRISSRGLVSIGTKENTYITPTTGIEVTLDLNISNNANVGGTLYVENLVVLGTELDEGNLGVEGQLQVGGYFSSTAHRPDSSGNFTCLFGS